MYSNPPLHGARLVHAVLTNAALRALWLRDVKQMAERIIGMRAALKDALQTAGSARDWKHIVDQIGMFCYTGLDTQQVRTFLLLLLYFTCI